MSLIRILGGLALIGIGILPVIKTQWFLENFGSIAWAEQHLGGSRMFYKLLGLLISLAGILLATNILGGILIGTIGRLFVRPGATLP